MRPLSDWDAAYLDELAHQDETASFEKKASEGLTREKIAQGVCAFANSGEGYMVFGFRDEKAGGGLGEGVPAMKGRQPIKDWAEALIPTLHQPPIDGCQARFIQHPTYHQPDRGVLVIAVPLSERRPHWTKDEEIPYLRVGSHSAPMRPQTLLDLSHRREVSRGEVAGLTFSPYHDETYKNPGRFSINLTPWVRTEGSPICESWAVALRVKGGIGRFQYFTVKHSTSGPSFTAKPDSEYPYDFSEEGIAFIRGTEPLFPHRLSRVLPKEAGILLHLPNDTKSLEINAGFFAAFASPTKKVYEFNIRDDQLVQR